MQTGHPSRVKVRVRYIRENLEGVFVALQHGIIELGLQVHIESQQQRLPVLLLVDQELPRLLLHPLGRVLLKMGPNRVRILERPKIRPEHGPGADITPAPQEPLRVMGREIVGVEREHVPESRVGDRDRLEGVRVRVRVGVRVGVRVRSP